MADGSRTAELEADAAAAEAASEARAEVLQRTAKTVAKAPDGKAEKRGRRAKTEFAEFVVDVWITNFNSVEFGIYKHSRNRAKACSVTARTFGRRTPAWTSAWCSSSSMRP
jgi:Zn-dependent protease with chaperone function